MIKITFCTIIYSFAFLAGAFFKTIELSAIYDSIS